MTDENQATGDGRGDEGRTATAWAFGFGAGVVILALLAAAYIIGFNRGEEEGRGEATGAATAPAETTEAEPPAGTDGPGRDLFVSQCGSCHVLAAAETTGTIGPDLDQLQPDTSQVLSAIENGGAGSGAMPANLVSGAEAEEVAAYVGANAGQ